MLTDPENDKDTLIIAKGISCLNSTGVMEWWSYPLQIEKDNTWGYRAGPSTRLVINTDRGTRYAY